MIQYLSVCSGVEAVSLAARGLPFEAAAFSEINPFASTVLHHHFPSVPNYGDLTQHDGWPDLNISLLAGGTPCQSFSLCGNRAGMLDGRGNLALAFVQLAARYRPKYVLWENEPGVLSSNGGRDFGSILGGLAKLGYWWAYRVLDAQFFGVPQRRRRVFVVGCLGGDRAAPSEILFEPSCVRRDLAPSQEQEQENIGTITTRPGTRYEAADGMNGILRVFHPTQIPIESDGSTHCLGASRHAAVVQGPLVRRLTPLECERLFGMPDNWTLVPLAGTKRMASDTQRYRAIGNSMAVPVVRWILDRIAANHRKECITK